jgi:hypothetical protein
MVVSIKTKCDRIAGSMCNILELAYLCTIILRSYLSFLYVTHTLYVTVICHVSERSAVLRANLIPFFYTRTMSSKDTILGLSHFQMLFEMITGLLLYNLIFLTVPFIKDRSPLAYFVKEAYHYRTRDIS